MTFSSGEVLTAANLNALDVNTITTATQPSFSVYKTGAWTINTDGATISFDNTRHNTGSHYNTGTYRFTAPTAGKYLFSLHFFMYTTYDNDTNTYYGFHKNGAGELIINHGVEGQDGGQAMAAVIDLAVNDYVDVRLLAGTGGSVSSSTTVYNSFTGHFLG
jgi:hypothetical protein